MWSAPKPLIWSNFINSCWVQFVICKVIRSNFGSWCSWGKSLVNRINLHGLTVEKFIIQQMSPIWLMSRIWAKENLLLVFSSWPKDLQPNFCHLGRHIEWLMFKSNPSIQPLGQILWNQAVLLDQFFRDLYQVDKFWVKFYIIIT